MTRFDFVKSLEEVDAKFLRRIERKRGGDYDPELQRFLEAVCDEIRKKREERDA